MPTMPTDGSRRHLLRAAAALAAWWSLPVRTGWAAPAGLAATPACHDADEPTLSAVEGPFFEPSSPQRSDLVEPDTGGHLIRLSGQVVSRTCRALPGVLIDLWHADENGHYDMRGYRYRGHQFTDARGSFEFRTIQPAIYPGRTRHFHLKLQAPQQSILTTQLFFPGEPLNRSDWIYKDQLLMAVQDTPAQMHAQYQFVLDV